MSEESKGASDKSDRATPAEPVVSALREGIPSALAEELGGFLASLDEVAMTDTERAVALVYRWDAMAGEMCRALMAWLHYDNMDDTRGVDMMLNYSNALSLTKIALGLAQSDQSPKGQDPQGLDAKHASGVAEGDAP